MSITTTLAACSTTPALNGPDGTVDAPSTLDDAIRYSLAFTATLRDTKAPLASPAFTGTPTAPTPVTADNSTTVATTAFVKAAVVAGQSGVGSFNGRTGSVTLSAADVTGAGGAPLASPALTGTPTAPTAATADNSTLLATTAFVKAAVVAGQSGVGSFNGRTGAVTLAGTDVSGAGGALSANLSASSGATLLGAISAGTGAVARTVQNKLQDSISVKDFGAVGDGVANDTAAIQAALNAASGKYAVYFPAGRYNVTAGSLATSGGYTRIIGEGINTTRIQSSAGAGSILTITQADFTQPILVSDLSIITYTQETQTGLTINGNATDSQINRVQARAELRNLEVRGDNTATAGPVNGIVITACHNLLLSKIYVSGRNDGTGTRAGLTKMTSGVQIIGSATGIPSDFTIQGCYVYQGVYGFNLSGGIEGANFTQCYAVACDFCYHSDQSAAGTRPWSSFIGCHAAAYVKCINLINVPQAIIANCLLYKRGESNVTTTAVSLTNCDLSDVHDNIIYNTATSFTTNGDFIGIAIGGASNFCNIHHNKIDRVQFGVNLVGTCQNTKTESNNVTTLFGSGVPQEYLNQSTGGGNSRLSNPRFENSQKNTAAVTLNSAATTALAVISPDTAEIGDEFIVTALIHITKDATAGGIKAFLAQTAGTGVPVFQNSFAQANGYCYLAASTDGYIAFSTVMKITTAGPITLTLSAATNAGGATVAVNDAQIALLRR